MYKTRAKMPPSHRAKQFMPFSAVKGLQEALREKEKCYAPKNEIAEDEADEINRLLSGLAPGFRADITYLSGGQYKSVSGEIQYIDSVNQRLCIEDREIRFSELAGITVPERVEN